MVGATPGVDLPYLIQVLGRMGGQQLPPKEMRRWQESFTNPRSATAAQKDFYSGGKTGDVPVLLPVTFDNGAASLLQLLERFDGAVALMFYARPEPFLLSVIAERKDLSPELDKWCTSSRALLEVIHRHRRRVVLFDEESAFRGTLEFTRVCRDRFGLEADGKASPKRLHVENTEMQRLIAAQVVAQAPEAQELIHELEACAVPTDVCLSPPKVNINNLLSESFARDELKHLKEENNSLVAQLRHVQSELESYYLRHCEAEKLLASKNKVIRNRTRKYERARSQMEELTLALQQSQEAIVRLRMSRSWRWTSPLRTMLAFFRALQRRRDAV